VIQQLFEKLGDKCRQLLMMVYYENLSMSEIVDSDARVIKMSRCFETKNTSA
jgi:hypothetical protein